MMAANGNGLSEKTPLPRVQLSLVLLIVSLVATAAVAYAKVANHCGDGDIHHTFEALDERYPTQAMVDQRFEDLQRTADRIEGKLDRMLEKRP